MESWIHAIQQLPAEWGIFLLSMLPIAELRGALPWGILVGKVPFWKAYPLAVLGNLVPIVPLLLLLDPLSTALRRIPLFDRFFEWLFERTRRRGTVVERYEALGLMIFVAIPLPVTGAWTGTVAALLFGIPFRKALLAISAGVCIAGAIVTTLTLAGVVGGIIAAVVLLSLAVKTLYNKF